MGRVPGIVKWVFAPLLAAVLGYSAIGPRLAGKVPIPKAIREGVGTLVPNAEIKGDPAPEPASSKPASSKPASPKVAPPPEVTVDAKPVAESKPPSEEEPPKPRRRRKRRRAVTPDAEAPPETAPASDRTQPDPASTP